MFPERDAIGCLQSFAADSIPEPPGAVDIIVAVELGEYETCLSDIASCFTYLLLFQPIAFHCHVTVHVLGFILDVLYEFLVFVVAGGCAYFITLQVNLNEDMIPTGDEGGTDQPADLRVTDWNVLKVRVAARRSESPYGVEVEGWMQEPIYSLTQDALEVGAFSLLELL